MTQEKCFDKMQNDFRHWRAPVHNMTVYLPYTTGECTLISITLYYVNCFLIYMFVIPQTCTDSGVSALSSVSYRFTLN